MALSLKIQNQIQQGIIRPADITLFELVILMAKKHGQYFINSQKTVPAENTDALAYLNKCLALSKKAISGDSSVYQNILSNLIVHVGNFEEESNLVFATTYWETLVSNNLPTIFELIAEVTNAEKTAYNAL